MTSLVTRWAAPAPPIETRWFGPDGRIEAAAVQRPDAAAVPAVIGPRGPAGTPGASSAVQRIDVGPAATWIVPHGFGRVPMVQVHLNSGEQVIADVAADAANVTVTFPASAAGFLLIS